MRRFFQMVAKSAPVNQHQIIIIAGQSNAQGRPDDFNYSALPPENIPPQPNIKAWFGPPYYPFNGLGQASWQPLQVPDTATIYLPHASYPEYGYGIEQSLAFKVNESTNRPVAIVKVGVGGSAINAFLPPTGGEWPKMELFINESIQNLIDGGIPFKVRAIVWMQGESDSNSTDAPLYLNKLRQTIAGVRAIHPAHLDTAPWINVKLIPAFNAYTTGGTVINAAFETVASDTPYCHFVDPVDFGVNMLPDSTHYSGNGLLKIGMGIHDFLLTNNFLQ
jgi:hypothetical protein